MQQNRTSLKTIALKNTFWVYFSTYSGKILTFIATTILARLLLKEDFGIAGYAIIFIGFLDAVNGLGVVSALIFFPVDEDRYNSAFWLGMGIGITLFLTTWFLAPYVGVFYNDMRAVPVTRILALTFPISALGFVHNAKLRKSLHFKEIVIPDLVSSLMKGITSIVLAFVGFGAWSLIIGQLVSALFWVCSCWVIVPWRPGFSIKSEFLKPLITYGFSIVSVNVLGILITNTDYLLVGRYLGAAPLGIYTLAFRVPELLIGQFAVVMGQVLFPIYSKINEDPELIKRGLFITLRYVSMITVPIGLGLALVAHPFVVVFFTDKWVDVIPILILIALASVINSFSYNFGEIYKAQGKPEILTRLSMLRLIILLPALWWAVTGPASLIAVGYVVVIGSIVGTFIQFMAARKIIGIPIMGILNSFRPAILGAFIMVPAVYTVLFILAHNSPLFQLFAGVLAGFLVYVGALWFFQREDAMGVYQVLRTSLLKK